MRKRMKRSRPSHGTVVAYLALFVALGGSAYAVKQLPKNSVGTKQLKKNAVTGVKIKKNAVTGAKVKESTLGTVPTAQTAVTASTASVANTANTANSANTANIADSLAPPEGWHVVGAPGEPGFLSGWQNSAPSITGETVAFFKDHEGVVHLRGDAKSGFGPIFDLPPGYRPAAGTTLPFPVACGGAAFCSEGLGVAYVDGPGVATSFESPVTTVVERVILNGIAFRAES